MNGPPRGGCLIRGAKTMAMKNIRPAGVAGVSALLLAVEAAPARAEVLEEWLSGDYATGNWGGVRDDLEAAGVSIQGGYVTDLQALTSGGASRGGNWDYAGKMLLGIQLDLEKLAGLHGLEFYVEGVWSSGEDLARKVGSVFPPSQAFTGRSVRLSKLYLQQTLAEDTLALKVGRLATEDDFLSSDLYTAYVSGAINGVPFSVPDSTPGFSTSPFSQWGAVAAWQPAPPVRAALGVFSSDEDVNKDKEHGVDFSLNPDNGILTIGEIGYSWNQPGADGEVTAGEGDAGEVAAAGLPGTVKLGGWYDSGPRTSLRDEESTRSDNRGLYVAVDQMVYREGGPDSLQGLTPWAVLAYAPRQAINQLPVFFAAGLVYQGLIPTRDDDRAALGFFWGVLSKDIQDVSSEKVLEVSYTLQLTPWFYVQPDAQFIFQPGGSADTSNAVVLGGEVGITF
jgi:porin